MNHPPKLCSFELIKTFRTSLFHGHQMYLKREIWTVRPRAHPQRREPGKSRRQADPSPQSLFQTLRTSFPPHMRENTAPPCTVKKIQRPGGTLPVRCGFHATDVSKGGSKSARNRPFASQIDGWQTQRLINQGKRLPISAVFRLRYHHQPVRGVVARTRRSMGGGQIGNRPAEW
jgi:hypothetical protein